MRKKIYILTSVLIISALIFSGCNNNKKGNQTPNTSPTASTVENTSTKFNQMGKPVSGDKIAIVNTSMGTIKIRLFAAYAPKAVENFIGLSKKGYYNGLIFHRVIKDFMIQGGDPNGNGTGGESIWGKPFEDEFSPNVLNYRGALSMANSGSNTNGSQFFIVQSKRISSDLLTQMKQAGYPQNIIDIYKKNGGTPWLDGQHTVFGEVFEGMNVVDKIANVKTDKNDKPIKDITVKTIKIETIK